MKTVAWHTSELRETYPFACLLQLSSQHKLVQYKIHLVEIEHQVQLADIVEEVVQDFNEQMDAL